MSLRARTTTVASIANRAQFLVVMRGQTWFAVPAEIIRGILTPEEAGTTETVTSLGVTYPVGDFADRFGIACPAELPEARTILCSMGNCHHAFRVDKVLGLTDLDRQQISPLPLHFTGPERGWFPGFFLFRDAVALLVNPGWLLGADPETHDARVNVLA
jgi:chemotaxis signal transduction protein